MTQLMITALAAQKKLTQGCKADTVLETVNMSFPEYDVNMLIKNERKATYAMIRDKINLFKGLELKEATQSLSDWLEGKSGYKRKACSNGSGDTGNMGGTGGASKSDGHARDSDLVTVGMLRNMQAAFVGELRGMFHHQQQLQQRPQLALQNGVEEELHEEVEQRLENELREEKKAEMEDDEELEDALRTEIKAALEDKLYDELRKEIKSELTNELLGPEIRQSIKADMEKDGELRREIRKEIKSDMRRIKRARTHETL